MAFRNPLTINPLTSVPASGIVGLIQGSQLAADSINGKTITGGTIYGETINGGTINGTSITGGTIVGTSIQTATFGQRWELGSAAVGQFGEVDNTLFGYTNSPYESDPALIEVGDDTGNGMVELLLRAPKTSGHAPSIVLGADYWRGIDVIYLNGQVSATDKLQAGAVGIPSIGANGGFYSVYVPFYAYFTNPPIVTLSTTSGRLTTSVSVAPSSSGFTVGINNWTPNNSAGGTLYWTAVAA